ncbi:hypothetical protein ACSBL2_01445 [Pedobacter sp. AW31-3R]|uniref:hypothetical protein n=1 Tax=Pedobacter sp. AW31-3R TaxID=3445781 RepID=UPI003F9EE59A
MKYPINTKNFELNLEYYAEVLSMQKEADRYISDFSWCISVVNSSLYLNLGEKLCIFLYEIDPAKNADNFVWLIVGDLPSMYLDVYGPKTTIHVLEDYVSLSKDWISNVESGLSVDECYPFDADPTMEMADLLKRRVAIIENSIIPNVDEIKLPSPLYEL